MRRGGDNLDVLFNDVLLSELQKLCGSMTESIDNENESMAESMPAAAASAAWAVTKDEAAVVIELLLLNAKNEHELDKGSDMLLSKRFSFINVDDFPTRDVDRDGSILMPLSIDWRFIRRLASEPQLIIVEMSVEEEDVETSECWLFGSIEETASGRRKTPSWLRPFDDDFDDVSSRSFSGRSQAFTMVPYSSMEVFDSTMESFS